MTTENHVSTPRSFSGGDARRLLRKAKMASLGTINRDDLGPYVSVANIATDHAGWPFVFISRLAWHTQNILANPRASLLVADLPDSGDVLTGARITVMGLMERVDPGMLRHRYLAKHPEAGTYIDFGDFSFWRLKPERLHAVAGFGRIETLPAGEVFPLVHDWEDIEDSAIRHMNDDHADAVQLYATQLLGAQNQGWKVAAVDPDGCDLVSTMGSLRLPFGTPAFNAGDLRRAFQVLSARIK